MKDIVKTENQLTRLDIHYLLTNIKGIMILLLVMYHFISPIVNETQISYVEGLPLGGQIAFCLLAMTMFSAVPLFVMIAGYGSKDTESCRESAFGLYFVPYIILMLLLILEYAIFSGVVFVKLFEPMMQMWFLFAMFIWMLILKDIASIRFVIPISIIISLVSGMAIVSDHFIFTMGFGSFFSLSYVVAFLPFLLIGVKITDNVLSKMRNVKLLPILAAVLVVVAIPVIAACVFRFSSSYDFFDLALLKGNADYRTYFSSLGSDSMINISGAVFRIALMVFSVVLGFLAIRFIPKKKIPFITRIGNASLTIFSLHVFIIIPLTTFLKLDLLPMFLIALPATALLCWLLSARKVNKAYMSLMFRIADAIKVKPKKKAES